ncbi:NUDIX hydrolase [Pseudaestuariivita sp.]|uniref:NUDIX hydrolase n=1 Tax=Pseudaestuariivita sp. TaxID=2211669 RepID=UPI004058D7E9
MKQIPLNLRAVHKSDIRTQFAALCYRVQQDKVQVLLITSRETKRWILPKGWPMHGKTPAECAATEAWEEAGVIGKPLERCIGIYSFHKAYDTSEDLPCIGLVYPVRVKRMVDDFPEKGQRSRKWLTRKKAAARVDSPELAAILRNFDPAALRA